MVKAEFNYDSNEDILYLHNKNCDSPYSIELSDEIIADVDAKGKIIGLEILGASK